MSLLNYKYVSVPVIVGENRVHSNRVFPDITSAQTFIAANQGARIDFASLSARLWRMREFFRLKSEVHTNLPLFFTLKLEELQKQSRVENNHFAHLSKDKERVAFTASHEHGVLDRQTGMAPGRYLKKYFSNYISDVEISFKGF